MWTKQVEESMYPKSKPVCAIATVCASSLCKKPICARAPRPKSKPSKGKSRGGSMGAQGGPKGTQGRPRRTQGGRGLASSPQNLPAPAGARSRWNKIPPIHAYLPSLAHLRPPHWNKTRGGAGNFGASNLPALNPMDPPGPSWTTPGHFGAPLAFPMLLFYVF